MAVLGGEDCNDLLVAGGTLKEVEELLGRTFITPAEQEHLRDQLLGSVTQTSPFDWIPDVSVLKVLDRRQTLYMDATQAMYARSCAEAILAEFLV